VKVVSDIPLLAVRLTERGGWEILTPPGTLAPLLVKWFELGDVVVEAAKVAAAWEEE
jgi:hypothetical protein